MVAPKQSELAENANIELLTLAELKQVHGEAGDFKVRILRRARYVSLLNCIGCGACFEPCPVSVANTFEEGLSERKAIYLACAGALPNAPAIDMTHCVRANGEDCTACRDACMFEAIDYEDKDDVLEVAVGAIVIATGFRLSDAALFPEFGYGKIANVFGAFEFERLRASNGATGGVIQTRDGGTPKSIGLIHCVGRKEKGYCSQVCCRYLAKLARYAFDKLEGARVIEFFQELSIPGKESENFLEETRKLGVELVRTGELKLSGNGAGVKIDYRQGEEARSVDVDMAVLALPIEPDPDAAALAEMLGVERDDFGFFRTVDEEPAATTRKGVFVAGCGEGPKDMQSVVAQAEAAAAGVLRLTGGGNG